MNNELPFIHPAIAVFISVVWCVVYTIIAWIASAVLSYPELGIFVSMVVYPVTIMVFYNGVIRLHGYNAYYAGVPLEHNPKIRGHNERYEWAIGWKYAGQEDNKSDN